MLTLDMGDAPSDTLPHTFFIWDWEKIIENDNRKTVNTILRSMAMCFLANFLQVKNII
jgi:hypothetical protein